ncbi:histone-lysine N-methyltransferase SMYD3 [Egretta garzetta]|uniref:histone-lysine N-methyltransferase SMYD3 n=1 Tax=Egretta garzetta TaxID=188379 RepID=UPI00163C22A1|nr:histone-lysine N-methyltransferase SMYD3 [Egretta garzetta]
MTAYLMCWLEAAERTGYSYGFPKSFLSFLHAPSASHLAVYLTCDILVQGVLLLPHKTNCSTPSCRGLAGVFPSQKSSLQLLLRNEHLHTCSQCKVAKYCGKSCQLRRSVCLSERLYSFSDLQSNTEQLSEEMKDGLRHLAQTLQLYLKTEIQDASHLPPAIDFFQIFTKLTISYIESLMPTSERQKQLMRQYCFVCDCLLCRNQEKDAEKLAGEEHAWKEVKDAVNEVRSPKSKEEWEQVLARCQNLLSSNMGRLPDTNIYQLKMLDCAMDACINLESWEEALYYGSKTLGPYSLYYPGFHPLRAVQLMRVGKLQYSQDMFPQALETLKQASTVNCFFPVPLPCFPQTCCVSPPSVLTGPHAFGYSSLLFLAVVFPRAAAEYGDGSLLLSVSDTDFLQYQSLLITVQ